MPRLKQRESQQLQLIETIYPDKTNILSELISAIAQIIPQFSNADESGITEER